ncbi:MAG: sugar ABC transporter permease [Proteobacteria bacterium]|nr:sugar ABC transporter permease [Pseudomonadota bacterium]
MEVILSVLQVLTHLFYFAIVLFGLEACLYWLLYRQQNSLYWPITAAMGLAGGLLYAGFFAGGATLAAGNIVIGVAVGVVSSSLFGLFCRRYMQDKHYRLALMFLAPAILIVSILIIYPFFFELSLAFSNLNLYTVGGWMAGKDLKFVGLDNFANVFTTSPLQTVTFWELFIRTIIWTVVNIVLHVGFGLMLALLLNKRIPGKGIYRTLLILPWAMPQVVAVLSWRGEFHPQFGSINAILNVFGMDAINWWSDPTPVFLSCIIVNVWLGIPFMMIVFLGGLQSIPADLYEAAKMDGASKWQEFRFITVPMLKPVVVPSVVLGTIWTFNNINVIYLMTGQSGGNEFADILISALYKSAFTYSRYSFAAAFAVVIFLILLSFVVFWMKITKGADD